MRYIEAESLDDLVELLDDGFTSCGVGKSVMNEVKKLKDEVKFYMRRNVELSHDKDLLFIRIIELEKKLEDMYYNLGE